MGESIRLVQHSDGKTSIRVDAQITDEGHLLFSGQDAGEAPAAFFGDEDYEYWLCIKAEHKDRVLLALIEKVYGGNLSVVSEFKEFLKSKGIPGEFSSYV